MTPPGSRQDERIALAGSWSIGESAATESAPPDSSAAPDRWTEIPGPMPVAAALRALGQWSLDDPPRDFDATDWWYRLQFDTPRAPATGRAVLGLDGLATLAQAWLNGSRILASDNMFVAHECDVTHLVRAEGNELLIRFGSLAAQLKVTRQRPRWRVPMVAHQQLRWLRTTLLGRTPGWSPPAAVVGPWKDIWLHRRGTGDVSEVRLASRLQGRVGVVECHLASPPSAAAARAVDSVNLRLERGGRVWVQSLLPEAGDDGWSGELRLPDAQPWWPHTHGEPALYDASVSIRMHGDTRESVIASRRIGFRRVELDTAHGRFNVRVNGEDVFCRGACWTPLDPVTLRSSPEACRAAVAQARDAGMNMLRVAGTTAYEEDHFYDACDELGVLVWQEFMFASMDYPAHDAAFTASVEVEAAQQLQRLRPHPCIAVWCGNSEVDQQAAMWGAPRDQWHPPLFHQTLARLCAHASPDTPYWPSSAQGGALPQQPDSGTTSYYGVGAYLRELDDARRSGLKFATECLAFANVPSPSCIQRMPGGASLRVHHAAWKARVPRDLGAGWDFEDVRDHYLALLYRVDPTALRRSDHERYLALSRIATGEAMAASFAEWRRPGSSCGGALVLSLRDLWPGAGWGVLDDAGMPKACWHYLRRALQPLTVFFTDEGLNGLCVHIANELPQARRVHIEVTAWRDGDVRCAGAGKSLNLPQRSTCSLAAADLLGHFMDLTYAYRFGPPPCDVVVATLRDAGGHQLAQAFHFPVGRGAAVEPDVGLTARARWLEPGRAEVTVRARRFAQAVHFDAPGFKASEDYFHLRPGEERSLMLDGEGDRSPAGEVRAVNSAAAAPIEMEAPVARALAKEQA